MEINDLIFTDNLPTLDIHGLDRDAAKLYIKEFINDNVKTKNRFIIVVHGKGTGILKQTTKDALKTNKNVLDYKLLANNIGATIIKLNV